MRNIFQGIMQPRIISLSAVWNSFSLFTFSLLSLFLLLVCNGICYDHWKEMFFCLANILVPLAQLEDFSEAALRSHTTAVWW